MKAYSYLSTIILFSLLAWNTSVTAQDDLYFDPATDEYFETIEEVEYGDYESNDEYVDEAFDDDDYYYDDDFFYSRRIRRFNRPFNSSFGYYNPWFTNNSYIDPFYYNSGPNVYVGFGQGFGYDPFFSPYGNSFGYNPYAYNPYGYNPFFNNPYAYNPYFNPYVDPCFNPYYSSFYSPYGYYGGNPYYDGNDGFNPYADYPTANANYGPRSGTGGIVDAFGNGRVSTVKQGRDNGEEAQELQYFEAGGRTSTTRGNTSRDPIELDANEDDNTRTGRSTRPTEIRSEEPSRSTTRPSRSTRTPRSSSPPRSSSRSSSPPRSSSPKSSSSSRSNSSNKGSSSRSSSRSGRSPR